MFKGLKTKIEDEAKRLQATVSHYGENIVQQVRSSASDAGSEVSGHARRFFSSPVPDGKSKNEEASEDVKVPFSEPGFSLEDETCDEQRHRHDSGNSICSNESTLSELFSSIPGMISSSRRLDLLSSDVEGESVAGSAIYKNASKEQISSVLHKLQGRAATYKDRYRELVKVYNELVRDNEKYKRVLAATQDKTIKRLNILKEEKKVLLEKVNAMEEKLKNEALLVSTAAAVPESSKVKKLEELLEKCKLSINEYKERNVQLNEENNRLRKVAEGASGEQGISDFAMQRINAEWKGKVDAVEAEYARKIHDTEEKATLLVAQVKADMHAAMEEKENEIQSIRTKCMQMKAEGLENERQKVELQSTIDALEAEKADMVNKLSEAKQKGVLVVREEEERKRKELELALKEREEEYRSECQKQFQEQMKKLEDQWRSKFSELEEQMQLAVEEREMQNAASSAEQGHKIEELQGAVEQLTADKLQLSLKTDSMREQYEREIQELNERMGKITENHKAEIANLIKEHDEIIVGIKKDSEEAKYTSEQLKDELSAVKEQYEKKIKLMGKQHEDTIEKILNDKKIIEKDNKQLNEGFAKVKKELAEVTKTKDSLSGRLKKNEELLEALKKEHVLDDEEISSLRQQLEELTENSNERRKIDASELQQLKGILEEKSNCIHQLEEEKEALAVELAAIQDKKNRNQELSEQLNSLRDERDEAKKEVLTLKREVDAFRKKQNMETKEQLLPNSDVAAKELGASNVDMKGNSEELLLISDEVESLDIVDTSGASDLKASEVKGVAAEQRGLQLAGALNGEKLAGGDLEQQPFAPHACNLTEEDRIRAEQKTKLTEAENEELKQKLSSLENKIADLQSQVSSSKLEMDRMNEEKLAFTTEKDVAQKMIQELSKNLSKMLDNLLEKVNLMDEQESRLKEISLLVGNCHKSVLEQKSNQILELEDQAKMLQADVQKKDLHIDQLQDRVNSFLKESEKKDLESQELRNTAYKLKEEVETLTVELESTKRNCAQTCEKLEDEHRRKEEFQKVMNEMQNEIDALKGKEHQLKSSYEDMVKEYEMRLRSAEKDLEKLEVMSTKNKDLEGKLLKAEETNEASVKALEKLMKETQENINKKIDEINAEKEAEIKNISDASLNEIAVLKNANDNKQVECDKLRDTVEVLQKNLKDLQEQRESTIGEVKLQLEAATNDRNSLVEKLKIAEHEVRELRVSSAEKETLLGQKLGEIAEMGKLMQETKERTADLAEKAKKLEEENAYLQEKTDKLEEDAKEFDDRMERLKKEAKDSAEQAKNDRQRIMNEVQKEIKRLYVELSERSKSLEEANVTIAELKEKLMSAKVNEQSQVTNEDSMDICNFDVDDMTINYEEVQSLKDQIQQYQREIAALRQQKSFCFSSSQNTSDKEQVLQPVSRYVQDSEHKDPLALQLDDDLHKERKCSDHLSPQFADPAEAEYLRYVLYRYMSERETLGKESVTLAKVIATVAKFSREQLEIVVAKEEQRTNLLFRPIF